MRSQPRAIALAAAAVLSASGAFAQEAAFPTFSVSGFGTFGVTQTDTDLGQYIQAGQPKGADKSADFGVDTKAGLQATALLNPMFSVTGQLLSKRDHESHWTPELEWGFVKAKLSDAISVRAGRMGAPFFMVSDVRNVGYANTWVRPPLEVYSQVTFSRFDGADLLYQHNFGDTNVNAQLFAGSAKTKYPNGAVPELKNMIGFNASAEIGPVTLRVGHSQAKLSISNFSRIDTLLTGLRTIGATALADDLAADSKKATFTGIGASVDWNDIIGSAEYTRRRTESYLADTTGWTVMGGYRLGVWTPYAQMGRLRQDSPTSSNAVGAPPAPAYAATYAALSAGVNSLLANVGQKSTAVGLRWDAVKNVAIKAQYDRVKVDAGGNGQFTNVKPGFGDPVNVYSLAVDYVW